MLKVPAGTTVAQALQGAARLMAGFGIDDPMGDARRLMAHVLGLPAGRLTLHAGDLLTEEQGADFGQLAVRRADRHEPVSHLIGSRLFWGREFLVSADVLDPRPETETLVACALEEPFGRLLDLGTGSGCILVTLLAEKPLALGLGVDVSLAALGIARENARRHGVDGRAGFTEADWFKGVGGRFDLIVSNPPYIALAEMAGLQPEVRDHEPRLALTDGGDGLSAYRAILGGAALHLAPAGRVIVEVGATQAEAVLEIGRAAGLGLAETRPDLNGRARACLFRVP